MKKDKVCLDFSHYNDADFATISLLIATNIAANSAIFVTPVPDITDVANTVSAFTDALNAAGNDGKNNVTLKNQIRQQLEQMLFQLGMYVMCIANGDIRILTLSGFPLVKERTPSQLGPVGMVTLSVGKSSGELLAKFKKPKGTLGTTFQITDEPPTAATMWRSEPSSPNNFLFINLVPGKQYWVRVNIIGSNRQSATSVISTMFVV